MRKAVRFPRRVGNIAWRPNLDRLGGAWWFGLVWAPSRLEPSQVFGTGRQRRRGRTALV